MSDVVIKVESLSKLYKIGARQKGYKTLRESMTDAICAPFRRLKTISQSTTLNRQSTIDNRQSDTIWALKDVSFEVKRGEVVGIIGRNGAGKTTLLKILSRITEPTEGRAEIHGRVGLLLQVGTGFHPELTGRENIYLNGAILGMRKAEIERKFDEIVSFAEIEKFIDTPVKRYSSGMYVRLAFAVAAHLEPEILLVDEVLAVGDAAFQKKCLGKMGQIAGEGRTVLFVSHNMAAVSSLCGQCIYVDMGRMKTIGLTEEVISRYLSESSGLTNKVPLIRRMDRKGTARARFTSFEVLDARTMRPMTAIISGKDVLFKIGYKVAPQGDPINQVTVGIQIFSANGTFLTAMNNHVKLQYFPSLSGEGYVYCKMYRCPLMTGTHYVTLLIKCKDGLADFVEQAAVLQVETGDFYGTGVVNVYGRQGMFANYEWARFPSDLK